MIEFAENCEYDSLKIEWISRGSTSPSREEEFYVENFIIKNSSFRLEW